jgi:hypothetical protein
MSEHSHLPKYVDQLFCNILKSKSPDTSTSPFRFPSKQAFEKIENEIREVFPSVLAWQPHPLLKTRRDSDISVVFELRSWGNLIFKTHYKHKLKQAYHVTNTRKSRALVKKNGIHSLYFPRAKLIHIDGKEFIVEEKMDIIPGTENQKNLYAYAQMYASSYPGLHKKLLDFYQQLTIFLCQSGFWDTKFDNISLLNDGQGLAVVDNDSIFSARKGSPRHLEAVVTGLERLMRGNMLPPAFFDRLLKTASGQMAMPISDVKKRVLSRRPRNPFDNFDNMTKSAQDDYTQFCEALAKKASWDHRHHILHPLQPFSIDVTQVKGLTQADFPLVDDLVSTVNLYLARTSQRTFYVSPLTFGNTFAHLRHTNEAEYFARCAQYAKQMNFIAQILYQNDLIYSYDANRGQIQY